LPLPRISLGLNGVQAPEGIGSSLQIVLLLTVLTLAPAILIMTTACARTVVVLSLLRQALGTQQLPPIK
jgi:flagellar biosynthesis protein FliP